MLSGTNIAAPTHRTGETVSTLFRRSLTRHHGRVAVADRDGIHDYARLDRRAGQIARALGELGCRPHSRVCLAVSHGLDLVASVLAVLRLGAIYVPVDTRNPIDRVRYIVGDSGATMIVCSGEHTDLAGRLGLTVLPLDGRELPDETVPARPVSPADLAYILYTSGSTGRPKGVGITHGNLTNYVRWASARYFRSPNDRIALYTTLAFDFTVTCIFPPLIVGASIGVHDGVADPMVIAQIVRDRAINVIKTTPSCLYLLSQLLNGHRHLRRLIVGGEELTTELAAEVSARLADEVDIINEYGPTEATVGCLTHTFDPRRDRDGSVPIGFPIPGMRAYVLDEHGAPADEGELCLSGDGVAPGYLHGASSAFTENPFRPGTTMYRTGDLVGRDASGVLRFAGRLDDQVKIRGNRVELSEVSGAILAHPRVTSAYVTAVREHGSRSLGAVVTGDDGLTETALLDHLRRRLPDYGVPTSLRVVHELPLTLNQKVDRAAVLTILGKRGD
jgi:amino acid adenylation domain-containing protein